MIQLTRTGGLRNRRKEWQGPGITQQEGEGRRKEDEGKIQSTPPFSFQLFQQQVAQMEGKGVSTNNSSNADIATISGAGIGRGGGGGGEGLELWATTDFTFDQPASSSTHSTASFSVLPSQPHLTTSSQPKSVRARPLQQQQQQPPLQPVSRPISLSSMPVSVPSSSLGMAPGHSHTNTLAPPQSQVALGDAFPSFLADFHASQGSFHPPSVHPFTSLFSNLISLSLCFSLLCF